MESCENVSVTPSSSKDPTKKCINKTLLTPCRSVGLRRKSSSLIKSNTVRAIDSPTLTPQCTPNAIARKKLGSNSIRDKSKKRKLDLSLSDSCNDDNLEKLKTVSAILKTEDVEKIGGNVTDSCSDSLNESPHNDEQIAISSVVIPKTPVRKCSVPSEITNDMILELVDNIRKKELKLRSFDEASIYAKKHNPEELRGLIMKWKLGCQDALREIQSLINGKGFSMSMAQMLDQFQVPYSMVNFNVDCDEFED